MEARLSPEDMSFSEVHKETVVLPWDEFLEHFAKESDLVSPSRVLSELKLFAVQVEIYDPAEQKTYSHPLEEFSPRAVLSIKDLKVFCEKLFQLQKVQIHSDMRKEWRGHFGFLLSTIMANASLRDFAHPEEYLERLAIQMQDSTFEHLHGAWHKLGKDNDLGAFFVKHSVPASNYESPDELHFSRVVDENQPGAASELSVVRYGRVSPEEVVVFAVQSPLLQGVNKSSSQVAEKDFLENRQKMDELLSTDSPWKKLFDAAGINSPIESPEQFLGQAENLFLYFIKVSNLKLDVAFASSELIESQLKKHFREWLADEVQDGYDNIFYKLKHAAGYLRRVEKMMPLLEQREKNIAQMNKFFRVAEKTTDPKVGDAGLKQVSPGTLTSFLLALKMFSQQGLTEVTIPTFFPLRQHDKDPDIDERMFKQTLFLALRAEYEMNGGVELVPTSVEEGCIRLRLHPPLKSKRPEFKNVLAGMEDLNYFFEFPK